MSLTTREELIHLSVTFSNSFAVVTVSVLLHKQKEYDHGGQEGKPCLVWFWRSSQSSVQNTLTSGLPCHCSAKMASHAEHLPVSDCQKGADPSTWLGKGKLKYSKIQGNTGFASVLDKVTIVPSAEEQRRRNINQISVEFRALLFTPRVQNSFLRSHSMCILQNYPS